MSEWKRQAELALKGTPSTSARPLHPLMGLAPAPGVAPTPNPVAPSAARKPPEFLAVWTDGSLRLGKSGWAWVDNAGGFGHGAIPGPQTDNLRAELQAILEALKATPEGSTVHLVADSQAALRAIAPYVTTTDAQSLGGVACRDLIDAIADLAELRDVHAHWVRGHSTDERNHAADKLASLWTEPGKAVPRMARERIVMEELAAALALIPQRDCVCIPERPEITWAKGHVKASTDPAATLQSVAVDAYRRDAEAFITGARDGRLHAVGKGVMAWVELVRHQEQEGNAPPIVIKQLDAVAPGWRVSSMSDLILASEVLTGRCPPRWKSDWLGMSVTDLRAHPKSGGEWLVSMRGLRDRMRTAGIGRVLDEKFPGWDTPATFIQIVDARAAAEKAVSKMANRETTQALQAAAAAASLATMETQFTEDDIRFILAARKGWLATTPRADIWYRGLRGRNLSPAMRIDLNEALPGWTTQSFGRTTRLIGLELAIAAVQTKPWSTRIAKDSPQHLVNAVMGLEAFVSAANIGRLGREPGALVRLRALRACESQGLLHEDLIRVLNRVAPKWRVDAPGALDKEWESSRLDFAKSIADQMIGHIVAGAFSGSRTSALWLSDMRLAEERGRIARSITIRLDEVAPGWRIQSPGDIDRVTLGLLRGEPIGDTETTTAAAAATETRIEPVSAAEPDERLATVTAIPTSRGALVREVLSLAQRMAAVAARLDAEYPGWQDVLDDAPDAAQAN